MNTKNSTNITFKNLTLNDVVQNLNYFKQSALAMSNYSAAFRFMWCRPLGMQFAKIANCLVFKCTFGNRTYFNYPMALCEKDEDIALDLIESYCLSNYIKLRFSAIPTCKMQKLVGRYGANMQIFNNRKWRDYLYNATDFIAYPGKKFAGQRNHVNKFKRLYNYEYCVLTAADEREIYAFLKRFESRQLAKQSEMAEEELMGVYQVLPYVDMLGLKVGAIKIDGKICAVSIGEKCGDQLIIHVEKALLEYEGIYPLMAQEFAKHNAIGGVLYINREDDSGDRGLRKSKLNYNPVCLVDKFDIHPKTALDGLEKLPNIECERVVLKAVEDASADDFNRLEYDEERNKYWGYNWREHVKGEVTPQYFLNGIRQDFLNKWEMPLGIYLTKNPEKINQTNQNSADEQTVINADYTGKNAIINPDYADNNNPNFADNTGDFIIQTKPEFVGVITPNSSDVVGNLTSQTNPDFAGETGDFIAQTKPDFVDEKNKNVNVICGSNCPDATNCTSINSNQIPVNATDVVGKLNTQCSPNSACGQAQINSDYTDNAGDFSVQPNPEFVGVITPNSSNVVGNSTSQTNPDFAISSTQSAPDFAEEQAHINPINHTDLCNRQPQINDQSNPTANTQSLIKNCTQQGEQKQGVYVKQNKLIGEVVLHNFNYKAECEIGVRLLPEYEGAGYANEALKNLINYALMELNIERVCAKCFKQNARSKKSLEGAGMRYVGEDETYFYFSVTAK